MKMKKRKLKKKFAVFFSLYFILLSSFFSYKTFSKYSTDINKNTNATVAKWDVSSNIPNASINLISSDEDNTYILNITNNSEVAAKYSIIVSNIPVGTLVALDNGKYTNYSSRVLFNNVGTIKTNATNKTKSHTIKFKAVPEAEEVSNRNIKIQVTFNQDKPK